MLLAGNTGYEGALEQAAHAGDGRLFAELRRRMRESGARGVSLTFAGGCDVGLADGASPTYGSCSPSWPPPLAGEESVGGWPGSSADTEAL